MLLVQDVNCLLEQKNPACHFKHGITTESTVHVARLCSQGQSHSHWQALSHSTQAACSQCKFAPE